MRRYTTSPTSPVLVRPGSDTGFTREAAGGERTRHASRPIARGSLADRPAPVLHHAVRPDGGHELVRYIHGQLDVRR